MKLGERYRGESQPGKGCVLKMRANVGKIDQRHGGWTARRRRRASMLVMPDGTAGTGLNYRIVVGGDARVWVCGRLSGLSR